MENVGKKSVYIDADEENRNRMWRFDAIDKEERKPGVYTKLVDKHFSPLILRKYTHWGSPIYVSLITDDDLSDLDEFVSSFMDRWVSEGWVDNIQSVRNLAGMLTEELNEYYSHAEGVAVILAVDKCFVASLHGDFMNHGQCKQELLSYLNLSAHV